MATDLKRLQTSLVRQFFAILIMIILNGIQLWWGDGTATYLIIPIFFLICMIDDLLTYVFESRSAMLANTSALETRLAGLEADLKEMKAKQTNAGPIGNDPVLVKSQRHCFVVILPRRGCISKRRVGASPTLV